MIPFMFAGGGGLAAMAAIEALTQPDYGIVHFLPTDGNPVYIKQQHLPAGWCVDTHAHKYDHWGLLGEGMATVEINGTETRYTGPCVVEIKANEVHKITALTSITWFCIHATTEDDVNKIDQTLIKES
jgi:quercetin dioxygenase-like cupin family protein